MTSNAYSDTVPVSLIKIATHDYLPLDGSLEPTNTYISPLLASTEELVRWLPQRMCITVGGREILRDDIVLFTERVQAEVQGTECIKVEVEEGVHNWLVMPWMLRNEEVWNKKFGMVMGWLAGAAKGGKE